MLNNTISIYVCLLAVSFGVLSLFRLAINGLVTIQSAELKACDSKIKDILGDRYMDLTTTLDLTYHHIAPKINRLQFIKKRFQTIAAVTFVYGIYLFIFWYGSAQILFLPGSSMELTFSQMAGIAFLGYFVPLVNIAFGILTILQVDDIEDQLELTLFKEFKKIKAKL